MTLSSIRSLTEIGMTIYPQLKWEIYQTEQDMRWTIQVKTKSGLDSCKKTLEYGELLSSTPQFFVDIMYELGTEVINKSWENYWISTKQTVTV